MSASTVSITAAPSARRRPVVVGGDKKKPPGSGIEIELVGGNGGDDDNANGSANGKDLLSHSIVQIKKALPTSSATTALPLVPPSLPLRRTNNRKGQGVLLKPEKPPRWQKKTLISVFTKNLLPVLVLLVFFQMIRRLLVVPNTGGVNTTTTTTSTTTVITEFDRRIAVVESFLKTTTKMMQVQVEVLDRKLENEIGGLRMEFDKKIGDKHMEFANELNKLDGRTESLEKSLGDFDWFSREDFDKFFDEFKKAKGLDPVAAGYGDVNLLLDEVRAFAREIVQNEIEKHAADGLGRVDYALASGGAVVMKHSEPYIVGRPSGWFYTTNRNAVVHSDAEKMLRPSFGEPGQCFPLKGSSGFVQIKLRTAIIPEAITLEHVAKSVAYDKSSAPKDCRVYGWLQWHDTTTDQAVDDTEMFLLTEFTYDLEKSNVQTFNVLDSVGSGVVDMIRLDFTSNHGSPHTCIYRLRVHGHEPNSVSMLAMQS